MLNTCERSACLLYVMMLFIKRDIDVIISTDSIIDDFKDLKKIASSKFINNYFVIH